MADIYKKAQPARIHLPCAGRFTVACAFVAAGAPPEIIDSSDVSLFSAVIGELAAGRKISEMGLKLEAAVPYSNFATDEIELGAAVLAAGKIAAMPARNNFEQSFRRHLNETAEAQVQSLSDGLRRLVDIIGGLQYETRDIRDLVEKYANLTEDDMLYLAMPTWVGDYAKMFGVGERMFGWDGAWAHDLEPTTRREVHDALMDSEALILSTTEHEHEVAPGWHVVGTLREYPGRVDYLVSNRKDTERHSFDVRGHPKPGFRQRLPLYDSHELTTESRCWLEYLDEGTALHYRGVWVHRLGITAARVYLGAFLDGQLFAVAGLTAEHFQVGQGPDCFELFGVTCISERYHRLSLLHTQLLRSGETRTLLESTGDANFTALEIEGVRSVSYIKGQHIPGKTDHRGSEVVSRKLLPDGRWEVYYRSPFRDDTWQETFEKWLRQHGRKRRPQPATAQPEPQSQPT
jgi:hypothetical protein